MTKSSRAFAVVLLVFAVLAVYYNATVPLYESPDELQHTALVVWLADRRALPVLDPQQPGPWRQEGTQPPLYYWIAARLAGWLPHAEADRLATLNPYANLGDPLRPGNKNAVLHDPSQEAWPYTGSTLFVHVLRLISTCMALGTLVAVCRLGRIVFPERPGVAVAMSGLVAFVPQFLLLSASVNNDNLVILFASWTLVLLVSWLRAPKFPNAFQLALLGVLLGLGALAKVTGLLLWPLAAGTLIWLAARRRQWRGLIVACLGVFVLALALSGWWFARNWWLYGDITAFRPHLSVMGGRDGQHLTISGLLGEFRGFRYSFWLLFGWFSILAPEPYYWMLDALTLLGLAGLGLFLIRSLRRQPLWFKAALGVLVAWTALNALGLLGWSALTPGSQGRLLYPALAPLAVLAVLGWTELLPRRLHRPVGIVALSAWGLWAAACPILILKPAYALPRRVQSLDQLSPSPAPLAVRFDDWCELVGYSWAGAGQQVSALQASASAAAPDRPIHPGDDLSLTLVWRALKPINHDYSVFVHARTLDGRIVGQADSYPGNGMYPTSLWQPGDLIVDTVHVVMSTTIEGPSLLHFEVGLYDLPTKEQLQAFSPAGTALDQVDVGEGALVPEEWLAPELNLPTDTIFAEKIRLAGVDLPEVTARPGAVVTVTLQWQALDRVSEDYTGFIHLVSPQGEDVTQDDHPALDGDVPTRLWFAGTVASDRYRLELPADLPEGRYELWGGLYRPESIQRLPAVEWSRGRNGDRSLIGRWKDDLVHLGTLEVVRTKQ